MTELHPYQEAGIRMALQSPDKRHIFGDEMGLGKTAQAILTCKRVGLSKILVVCPAIVRYNWEIEFDKWWVGHPEVGLITAGLSRGGLSKNVSARLALAYKAQIKVVSYNLLDNLPIDTYDVIILDECHRIKSPLSLWSKQVRKLVECNHSAYILGLTATVMPNKPLDAVGICECIWPGRFGGLAKNGDVCYKAKARYTNPIHNGYGWEFKGINELYANELRERLATTTSRTTKLQVAHLLPPFDVKQLYIEHPKQPQIKEWAQDALEQNSHIAILTHLRATAEQIVQALQAEQPYLITGALGPEKRNMLLAEAKAKPSAIIVATMHSIGIGIDLTFCQTALFAELYYRPETIIQALGRFSRLSGKVPTSCVIMIEKNTNDEIIGMKLGEKIQAINMAIEAGLTDTKLEAVLNSTEGWEDELFKACKFEEESDDY